MAIFFILGLAGFAAGVIPQACRSGAVACDGSLATESLAPVEPVAADAGNGPSPASQSEAHSPQRGEGTTEPEIKVAAVTNREPATLTNNDLVAATFDMLNAELVATPGDLVSRKVKTVSIGTDGQPVGEAKTDAAGSAPLTPAGPADVAAAPAQEEEPAPEPPATAELRSKPVQVAAAKPEEDVAPVAYAPVREGTAVIKGSGVNVRSAPKKGANEVLFTLAGGEEVTVVEMSKGWAKIVDSRGRSGWAYRDFLKR